MKRTLLYLLLLPFFCLACSDNDNSNGTSEEEEEYEIDETTKAQYFSVQAILYWLTEQGAVPDDFSTASFEPTVGSVRDAAAPYVRAVQIDSMDTADLYFTNRISNGVTLMKETSDGYSLSLLGLDFTGSGKKQDFGTLVFHRESDAARIGYIEIDIPCIPNLTRIDLYYDTGTNGSSESPYHIGDLVWCKKAKDKGGQMYYVCVREYDGKNEPGRLVAVRKGEYGEIIEQDGSNKGNSVPYSRIDQDGRKPHDDDHEAYTNGASKFAEAYITWRKGALRYPVLDKHKLGYTRNETKAQAIYRLYRYLKGEFTDKGPEHGTGHLGDIFPEGMQLESYTNSRGQTEYQQPDLIYNGSQSAAYLIVDGYWGPSGFLHRDRVVEYVELKKDGNDYASGSKLWYKYSTLNSWRENHDIYTVDGFSFTKNKLSGFDEVEFASN